MADNISITQGSGTNIATDDVSGVQHQLIKNEYGDDGSATMVSDTNPFPTRPRMGVGSMLPVPSGSTNGTVIGTKPAAAIGVQIYLNTGDALTFACESSAPGSAPANTFPLSAAVTGPNWFEYLTGTQNLYITSKTGSPKFRWI